MASFIQFILLFACFSCLKNAFPVLGFRSNSVLFPVLKDPATLQYVARISHGTPLEPTNLVVDLGGPFVWMDCNSGPVSSSKMSIPSCSVNCSRANRVRSNGCHFNTNCNVFSYNSITGLTAVGELVEDAISAVAASSDQLQVCQIATTVAPQFLFSCAPASHLKGLASGAKGILGLGKASISLPSQLSYAIGHPRKHILCLSESNGLVVTGNGNRIFGTGITKSLTYTPLIKNQHDDYYISVRSIKINGRRISADLLKDEEGKTGTKLSTIQPYTTMESSVFATFSKAYIKAAISMNITRVADVAPFRLCFSSNNNLGPLIPEIDLVLQSEMVKWRIQGRNSMVKVSKEVICLGFVDGGLEQSSPIVIGGLQLEDNLLEFDLESSMLGFSSSLLLKETTCSNFLQEDSKLHHFI